MSLSHTIICDRCLKQICTERGVGKARQTAENDHGAFIASSSDVQDLCAQCWEAMRATPGNPGGRP